MVLTLLIIFGNILIVVQTAIAYRLSNGSWKSECK